MENKYKVAKKQGLNWQALLIEEKQTEIKVLIQKMILGGSDYYTINKAVTKLVSETVNELESEQLKVVTKPSLLKFATMTYNYLKQTYMGLSLYGIGALVAVSQGIGTPRQISYVSEIAGDSAYNKAVPLNMFSKDYMKFIKERMERLARYEAKEDYTSRVNLRNIAEMQVRQERHEQEMQELRDSGENLVWIEPHSNCSERCEHWQGKLYSLNGTYGTIDGIEYQPLENATDIYETTKSGKIYKNGCLTGFNCRHTTTVYRKGNKPVPIPSKVVDRQRAINNKQRYLERGVREWREKALLFKDIDKEMYNYAKAKAVQWNKRYISFSERNNVAYYPDRTKII